MESGSLQPQCRLSLLEELTAKASLALAVFESLPPSEQLDGLDILQGVLNRAVNKITNGRITSLRFIPCESGDGGRLDGCDLADYSIMSKLEIKQEIKEESVADESTWDLLGLNSDPDPALPFISRIDSISYSEFENNIISCADYKHKTVSKDVDESKRCVEQKKRYCRNQPNPNAKSKDKIPTQELSKDSMILEYDDKLSDHVETRKNAVKKNLSESKNTLSKASNKSENVKNVSAASHKTNNNNFSNSTLAIKGANLRRNERKNANAYSTRKTSSPKKRSNKNSSETSENLSDTEEETDFISKSLTYLSSVPDGSCFNDEMDCDDRGNSELELDCNPELRRKIKSPQKKFPCTECKFTANRKFLLADHMTIHTGTGKHRCEVCDKYFTAASSLKRHMMAHEGIRPFCCLVCGKRFLDQASLRDHAVVHTGVHRFSCRLCGKAYTHSSNLSRHMRVHNGSMPYSCKLCPVRYRDLSSLKLHMLKHTGEKPYTCNVCDKLFKTSSDLRRHERVHTGERNYRCDVCGMKFGTICTLTKHKEVHMKDRPMWTCNVCGKCLTTKPSFERHLKGHAGIKSYQCDICFKKFTSKMGVRLHQVVHTKLSPYRCATCGKSFNQRSNFKRHLAFVHSDLRRYSCNDCGKSFKYTVSLKYHEQTAHSDSPRVVQKKKTAASRTSTSGRNSRRKSMPSKNIIFNHSDSGFKKYTTPIVKFKDDRRPAFGPNAVDSSQKNLSSNRKGVMKKCSNSAPLKDVVEKLRQESSSRKLNFSVSENSTRVAPAFMCSSPKSVGRSTENNCDGMESFGMSSIDVGDVEDCIENIENLDEFLVDEDLDELCGVVSVSICQSDKTIGPQVLVEQETSQANAVNG